MKKENKVVENHYSGNLENEIEEILKLNKERNYIEAASVTKWCTAMLTLVCC